MIAVPVAFTAAIQLAPAVLNLPGAPVGRNSTLVTILLTGRFTPRCRQPENVVSGGVREPSQFVVPGHANLPIGAFCFVGAQPANNSGRMPGANAWRDLRRSASFERALLLVGLNAAPLPSARHFRLGVMLPSASAQWAACAPTRASRTATDEEILGLDTGRNLLRGVARILYAVSLRPTPPPIPKRQPRIPAPQILPTKHPPPIQPPSATSRSQSRIAPGLAGTRSNIAQPAPLPKQRAPQPPNSPTGLKRSPAAFQRGISAVCSVLSSRA